MQMAKETEKRLIRTLKFLKEPQGSTIPTLVKILNSDQPQISLKRILQTLRGCQLNGIVKVLDGRVRLSQNTLGSSFKVSKEKEIADQVAKNKNKRGNTRKPSMLSKLDEIHGKTTATKSKLSKPCNKASDHTRIAEFDDDPSPPDSEEGGEDPNEKKIKPKTSKKKPRCPKKKPKCPKKKPKCPKKKPKCPKKKPKCPKPKPKCPKPKPKCPKPKPKC